MIFFVILFVIEIAFYVYYLSHCNYSESTSEKTTAPTSPTVI